MSRTVDVRRIRFSGVYLDLFRLPHAAAFFVPAVAARFGVAMMSLGVLWAVKGTTGSFAIAGLATGCFAAAEALITPQVARYVDSYGQRRVVLMLLPIFAAACGGLLIGGQTGLRLP